MKIILLALLAWTAWQISVAAQSALTPRQARPQAVLYSKTNAVQTLPAGVYRTVPFTGLVLVPGPSPEDKAVIVPKECPPMPVMKPALRFVPWPEKK